LTISVPTNMMGTAARTARGWERKRVEMKRSLLVVIVAGILPLVGGVRHASAESSHDQGGSESTVRCTGTVLPNYAPGMVTGTVDNVVVPPNNFCILEGARVTHDVIVMENAGLGAENSSVGHDVLAYKPWEIETGNTGPFTVGHDFRVTGSDLNNSPQGYDICDTTVGHDLAFIGTGVQYEIEIGDNAPLSQFNEFCATSPSPGDAIGHDLVVAHNTAGKIDVGNNQVGHDLVVADNTGGAAAGDLGDIGVNDNVVSHDATCTGNTPALSKDGPEDGGNHVGHRNNGCPTA